MDYLGKVVDDKFRWCLCIVGMGIISLPIVTIVNVSLKKSSNVTCGISNFIKGTK